MGVHFPEFQTQFELNKKCLINNLLLLLLLLLYNIIIYLFLILFNLFIFFLFIVLSVMHIMQGHWIFLSHREGVETAQTKTDAPGQTATHTETAGCKNKQTTADSTVCDLLCARKAVFGLARVLKA